MLTKCLIVGFGGGARRAVGVGNTPLTIGAFGTWVK